jgi:hypothetical protein
MDWALGTEGLTTKPLSESEIHGLLPANERMRQQQRKETEKSWQKSMPLRGNQGPRRRWPVATPEGVSKYNSADRRGQKREEEGP